MSTQTTPIFDGRAKLVYLIVLLVSLLLILLGVIYHEDWKVAAPFLKEVGYAGLISIIVIFTIEKFSRESHKVAAEKIANDMITNLFHAVYKRYIPDAVFSEVEKCLMHSNVFRRRHEVNYTIKSIKDGDGDGVGDCNKHVKCWAQSSYILENVSNQDIEHTVLLKLERPIEAKWDEQCKILSVTINDTEISEADVISCTSKDDVHVIFSRKVTIPAKGNLKVASSSTLLKQKTDSEIWASRLPSDGFRLTISMPSQDISVSASALHFEKLVPILNNDVTKSWELNHGIFPFQSVIFWWHSK